MTIKPKAVATIAADASPVTSSVTSSVTSGATSGTSAASAIPAPRTFDKAVEAIKHNAETATATATQTVTQGLEQAQSKMKQGVDRAMKTAEQFAQFHQGNLEAVVKSGQIWATGLQDLSKHVASNAQTALDETMSTFRALTSVKSLKEAFELQSSFARASMEKVLTESTKLTETSLKLAEQATAPLTARVNAAVEVFTTRN
jgi:phasin family protein